MSNESIDQFIRAIQSKLERLLDLMIEDKLQVIEWKKGQDNTKGNTETTQKFEKLYTLSGDFKKIVPAFKDLCAAMKLFREYKGVERAWLVRATEEQFTIFEQKLESQKIDFEILQPGEDY